MNKGTELMPDRPWFSSSTNDALCIKVFSFLLFLKPFTRSAKSIQKIHFLMSNLRGSIGAFSFFSCQCRIAQGSPGQDVKGFAADKEGKKEFYLWLFGTAHWVEKAKKKQMSVMPDTRAALSLHIGTQESWRLPRGEGDSEKAFPNSVNGIQFLTRTHQEENLSAYQPTAHSMSAF